MKNPIIIEVNKEIKSEKDLELSILSNLSYFLNNWEKVLSFNIKLNCYFVESENIIPLNYKIKNV